MRYFVHYTILDQNGPEQYLGHSVRRLYAGPYTMDEAIAKRRDLESDNHSINVFIEEETTK